MAVPVARMSFLHYSKSVLPQLVAARLAPYSTGKTPDPPGPSGPTPKSAAAKSSVAPPSSDNKSYQVQGYYGHNEMTFYDYEVKMQKWRLPQPSAKTK